MLRKIKGIIKEYDWGSYDALPLLFGYEVDTKPQAEAWFGTHPSGCSILENGMTLKEILQDEPKRLLGDYCYRKYGEELPLLLKVIATRAPHSIQCHPSAEAAKAGFEAEAERREAGTPLSELDFKDPDPKEEIFYALSPVTALYGFRNITETRTELERVMPNNFRRLLTDDNTIENLFAHLLELTDEEKKECIEEMVSNMIFEKESSDPRFLGRREIVQRSYRLFGDDIGIIIVYMMNLIWLEKGESVYLAPGTVHSYTFGTGIELMNLSDNNFRGGLTNKKTNTEALLEIMDSSNKEICRCQVEKDAYGRDEVISPAEDFTLFHMGMGSYCIKAETPSLLLSTCKETIIEGRTSSLHLSQGECCFISADEEEYKVNVEGEAFQASVNQ